MASSGGALKLLDDLDELASLLGTSSARSKPVKPRAQAPRATTPVLLSPVASSLSGEMLSSAVESARLSVLTGLYTDSHGTKMTLSDALEKDLINADSAAFIDPSTAQVTSILVAIQNGLVQQTGHYMDTELGKRLKLKECLERRIIVPRDIRRVNFEDEDEVIVPHLDLADQYVIEVLPLPRSLSLRLSLGLYLHLSLSLYLRLSLPLCPSTSTSHYVPPPLPPALSLSLYLRLSLPLCPSTSPSASTFATPSCYVCPSTSPFTSVPLSLPLFHLLYLHLPLPLLLSIPLLLSLPQPIPPLLPIRFCLILICNPSFAVSFSPLHSSLCTSTTQPTLFLLYSVCSLYLQALDPMSSQWISVKQAIARGVYDPIKDRYFNMKTGELLTSAEAAQRKLVRLGIQVMSVSISPLLVR